MMKNEESSETSMLKKRRSLNENIAESVCRICALCSKENDVVFSFFLSFSFIIDFSPLSASTLDVVRVFLFICQDCRRFQLKIAIRALLCRLLIYILFYFVVVVVPVVRHDCLVIA